MAIIYRLVQDRREASAYRGQWFARAVNMRTVETDELAALIERNCTVKRSDVLAVLTELGDVVRQQLASSHRVRLKGIGSFMAGIGNARGAATPADFGVGQVRELHLCFTPERDLLPQSTPLAPLPPNAPG